MWSPVVIPVEGGAVTEGAVAAIWVAIAGAASVAWLAQETSSAAKQNNQSGKILFERVCMWIVFLLCASTRSSLPLKQELLSVEAYSLKFAIRSFKISRAGLPATNTN